MSQKMVLQAKRKEMERFKRMKVYRVVSRESMEASGRYVGKLERPMNGTRDAPMLWQDHIRETQLDMKFKESVAHPGVFQHETSDILLCVHVDDLLCTGVRDDLMWLTLQLLKESELETRLMGDDDDMEKKAVYLGGTREWSEDCLGVRMVSIFS